MASKLFLRTVCILVLLDFSFAASDHDHDHNHGDEENFVDIGNFLLDEELSIWREEEEFVVHGDPKNVTITQMQILVETIFGRVDCTSRVTNCSECATSFSDDIFASLGVEQAYGMDEHTFLHASATILYGTYELEAMCQSGGGGMDLSEEAVENALRSAGSDGANDTLSEEDLDVILDTILEDYAGATLSTCFNVESVFDEAVSDHEAGAVGEEMLSVCQSVVAGLLQGHCIGEASVPTKEAFVDSVFDSYATSGVIPEEEFEEMLAALGIGGTSGHDHNHDHAHRRSVDMVITSGGRSLEKRATDDDHDHDHDHNHTDTFYVNETCYSAEELLDVYAVDHEAGITEAQFSELSSSLVQQILSGACEQTTSTPSTITNAQTWGYGTLAVAIISAISLLGGAFVPCMSSGFYEKAIQTMIALAVATLTGDAILHLIPQAVGLHAHEPGEAHAPSSEELAYVWRCLVVELAVYIFFVFEQITHFMGWFAHSHGNAIGVDVTPQNDDETGFTENGHTVTAKNGDLPPSLKLSESKKELTKCEYGTMETEPEPQTNGINTVAVMIILGDSLHNFGDGLAIGAAFTVSLGAGLSTSIAVLCHELPHELGDLAVLLKQGMKLSLALFLNLLSACTAFLGLWIGIPLTQASEAREWIFAVVAGMFLYVGLVDMMPILHAYEGKSSKKSIALLQNIGFLVGVAIILVIALYEDAISISI